MNEEIGKLDRHTKCAVQWPALKVGLNSQRRTTPSRLQRPSAPAQHRADPRRLCDYCATNGE